MQLTIHYAAQARQATGVATEIIDFPAGSGIRELLLRLAEHHGDALRRLILTADERPQPALLLFVNDAQVRGDERPLCDGDTVMILPPIAGG